MKLHPLHRGLIVVLVLALASLACISGSAAPTPTRQPRPTQRPQATATLEEEEPTDEPEPTAEAEATDEPEATNEPEPTEGGGTEIDFTLGAEPYAHPSGAFSLLLPEGWEIDEREDSIYLEAPDNSAAIEVSFVNVIEPLEEESLNNFILAVEQNWFGGFANFTPGELDPQSDGSIGVFKSLELDDGTPQSVFSYYWQEAGVVYEQDFWVNADLYDLYVDGLLEVANSMTTDPSAAADFDPYAISYTFTGPNNLFEFAVPYAWAYTTVSDDKQTTDSFTSPDGLSYVENITYDDGENVTKSEAFNFARFLLKDYYGVDDIVITDTQVQSDGSERLNWYSNSLGKDGTSFFETRGTTFLLLTWIVNTDVFETFFPVWTNLLDTYTIPEPVE